jgi:hypothetical protein
MSVQSEVPKKPRSLFVRVLKWAGLVVLAVAVAVVVIGLFVLDGKFEVARDATIQAPPAAVYKQVGDLREWPNWLPFTKHDPSVKTTIEQPTGVGANQHWTSDHGNGKLAFTQADEAKGVTFDMVFDEKWLSRGSLAFAPAGDGTRVTWTMTGHYTDFLGKWVALCMPRMVGPMFDEGLADLKAKVEGK